MNFVETMAADLKLSPIVRWRFNAPHITWSIKCQAQQPKLLVFSERDTVDHASSDVGHSAQTMQPNTRADIHRAGGACSAPVQVYENYVTGLGKWMNRIETDERDRNVAGNPSTAPHLRSIGS